MKLIESKAEYIPQEEGLEGIYKQIELCGRTCYKSEDKITEDSAGLFVKRMIASNHLAMLEHGTVYLDIPNSTRDFCAVEDYALNKYTKQVCVESKDRVHNYVTTNLRVLVENNWLDDLQYLSPPTEFHEKRYTFKFTCDRGVSHELVRHRVFSFAQESQRYCNYSKKKYDEEITFIKPSWLQFNEEITVNNELCLLSGQYDRNDVVHRFLASLVESKYAYLASIKNGLQPQQARAVLPNATKTEICMTGFASDWRYFFDLRLFGKTGAPHPDMLVLANKAKEAAEEAGIWKDIMNHKSKFKEDDSKTTD